MLRGCEGKTGQGVMDIGTGEVIKSCPMWPLRNDLLIGHINQLASTIKICGGLPYEIYLETPVKYISGYHRLKSKVEAFQAESVGG